ncbi:MAG: hypothetical protein ACXV5D_07560 [Halobacteriota archaeon]
MNPPKDESIQFGNTNTKVAIAIKAAADIFIRCSSPLQLDEGVFAINVSVKPMSRFLGSGAAS